MPATPPTSGPGRRARPATPPDRTAPRAAYPPRTRDNALDPATETSIELLVAQCIRRGAIGERDREDLAQHLRIVVLEAHGDYDPATASWSTFIGVVLQRAIGKWIRYHRCACRKSSQAVCLPSEWGGGDDVSACLATQATDPALVVVDRLSWGDALGALRPDDRRIAELLMGHDAAAVLRLTRWSKARFYRAVARIRKAFRQAGFGAP